MNRRQSPAWSKVAGIAMLFVLTLIVASERYASESLASADGSTTVSVLHGPSASVLSGLAMLPAFFASVISPLSLFAQLGRVYGSRRPDAPLLPFRFQRPPPIYLA